MISTRGWLENLFEEVNTEQLTTFLSHAIPELENDYQTLQTHLQNSHWSEAARQACKCKAVVKLLGMNDLMDYLLAIEHSALPLISSASFQRDLALCYYSYAQHWKDYFNEQTC